LTIHNLSTLVTLMIDIRMAIVQCRYAKFASEFLEHLESA